ncbi:MAG: hypothetical protein IH959_05405 [Chloroflexi bacterium]|nr:hypothetical protein [Chloroflexota bacterium]
MSKRGRPRHPDILTPREWEVLDLIREGLSNERIASRLGISIDGAKFHVSEILGKLGVANRHEAARWSALGGEEARPWWLTAGAPLLLWRRLPFGWLSPALVAILAGALFAGIGLLVWALLATRGDGDERLQIQAVVDAVEVRIAAGSEHTCLITPVGGVKCWGRNDLGQLGDGTEDSLRTTAVDVAGLDSDVVAIAAGESHTCALLTSGAVRCWGENISGQLGNRTTANSSTPVDVENLDGKAVAITAGIRHTCALTAAGGVKCWGTNAFGQIGDGTIQNRSEPVGVSGLQHGVVAIGGGGYHTCAVTVAGGVKCWGRNSEGQVGNGTLEFETVERAPVDVVDENRNPVSGMQTVAAGGGYGHTCALTTARGVICWGSRVWGEVGDGIFPEGHWRSAAAVSVVGLSEGTIAVSAGGPQRQGGHTCVVMASGDVMCWGRGYDGQLGEGLAVGGNCCVSNVPVPVAGLDAAAVEVATGGRHSCALLETGAVNCWGKNTYGQLGEGTTTDRITAASVIGLGASDQ